MYRSHENHGRACIEGETHIVGIEKNRAMQNMEGVHQLLIPELGNKPWCACMEGVHIWRVLEWRVHCNEKLGISNLFQPDSDHQG